MLCTSSNQKGSALVIAVFVVAMLSVMALTLAFMSENELKLGRADMRGKTTFYVSEAGMEHGRLALFDTNGKSPFDGPLLAAAGGTVDDIELNVDDLVPTYDAAGILAGFTGGYGDDVPLLGATTFAEGAYVAFLTNDPVDGSSTTTDTNGRVMITAVGGTAGRSLETVQAIIEHDPLFPTIPKAAITLVGPAPSWTPGSSSAKLYTGNDCNGAGEPGVFAPTVGVVNDSAVTDVQAAMSTSTYEAGPLAPADTIANLNDMSHPAVSAQFDPMWENCEQLHDFVELLRGKARTLCLNGASCALPASSLDNFIFVDDDFTMSPINNSGLLVVTGTLTLPGNFGWNGIVLVTGEGRVLRSGGGSETIMGTVLVADIAGPDNTYGNSDDCSSGFESPTWDTSGGGGSTVAFCSGSLFGASPHDVYRIVEFCQR